MQRKGFKNLIILFTLLIAFALLFSCSCGSGGDNTGEDAPEVTKPTDPSNQEADDWTVLIYLCGSSLESKYGAATQNINEMTSADLPEKTNIVLQTGGAKDWKYIGISASSTDRYLVENNALTLLERDTVKQNFGESATLTSFIQYGLKNYPAEHTALILWDHGGGSLKGVCSDENFGGDMLTLPELGTALQGANLSKKFDFIGFDACLMATYECAATIAPYAGRLVASEEKEPTGGWDYSTMVSKLGSESFYDDLLTSYANKSAKRDYYTLSCFDLSGIGVVDEMFSSLIEKMELYGKRMVVNAVNSSTTFGLAGSGIFDLGNLFAYYEIEGEYAQYIKKVNSALRAEATGLSVYFPLYNDAGLSSYLAICQNEEYRTFLTNFSADNGETINFENYAEAVDDKLAFTLDANSMAYFAEAEYILLQYAPDTADEMREFVYLLGKDNDVAVSDNKVTVSFEGRWVAFGGKLLCCTILDSADGYTVYQAPVIVNGEQAMLLFGYNITTRTDELIGVTFEKDDYGRIISLNQGDEIVVVKKRCNEDGYVQEYAEEDKFIYTDQTLEVVSLPDGRYQYTAYVKDINGKTYTAGSAIVSITDGKVTILFVDNEEVVYPDI